MDGKLESYLKKNSISYEIYHHENVHTVQESKKVKSEIPGLHCKTLFLKDNKGNFYLVGMKADKRLNTKILKAHFNVRKLNFASEDELKGKLKISPGSVSIFNLANAKDRKLITLVIDEEVWVSEYSGFHPNQNDETIVLNHKNLEKYVKSLNVKREIIYL